MSALRYASLLLVACWFGISAASAQVLTIDEDAPLSFGTLKKPGASESLTISSGGAVSGSGSILYGMTSRGEYTIHRDVGNTSSTISIEITGVHLSDPSVTLSNFTGKYGTTDISSFPAGGLPMPVLGAGTPLYIGATATYTSGVSTGNISGSFDIVVNYE